MRLLFLLLCALLYPDKVCAFPAQVIHIADGDTITVLDKSRKHFKVRLYGIDSPEKRQAFGHHAKQFMSRLVAGGKVELECVGKDRYGRTLGIVFSSSGENINQEMITGGMAWVYRQYCKRPECVMWINYERQARAARRGLWIDSAPIPPWTWRKMKHHR